MNCVVVYKSISGFTKKYAEWISEELNCDIFEVNAIDLNTLKKYDIIIYGGSLHAVGIAGSKFIIKNLDALIGTKIVMFTTGASPTTNKAIFDIKKRNFSEEQLERIMFFYFRGGYNHNKLPFKYRAIMNLMRLFISLKPKNKLSPDEIGMREAFKKPVDYTDKNNLKELFEYLETISK